MKGRSAFVVAGLTLAAGLCGPAEASPPSITAVAYNQAGVDADTLARAKSEVMRIYREAGVGVTWMDPAPVESAGAFAIQLLVRLRAVKASSSVMGRAIGGTHETGGLAFVYYDRVLRSAHEREQDVARLLGVAMAHEMGHLLLPPAAHSPSGIMRPDWDGDDLRRIASGSLRFTPAQANAIRAKISDRYAAAAAATSAGLLQPRLDGFAPILDRLHPKTARSRILLHPVMESGFEGRGAP